MFSSLKKHQKLTNETTYTWGMFKNILSSVIKKLIRDINNNIKNKLNNAKEDWSEFSDSESNKSARIKEEEEKIKEFKVDDNFFKNALIPSIHGVISSSIHIDNLNLFNLLFALEVSIFEAS